MGIQRRTFRRVAFTVAGGLAALVTAGPASAFQPLPAGGQVNDDVVAGINPTLSVSGEDPANSDVVGGALTAGKVAVPWAIFGQQEASGDHDQIFSRSFAAGAWTTRGSGTVGGRSSAGSLFSGSLNFDQTKDGEAPSIDFAGAGRTVPWASWYENTSGADFANNNVFASRFDNTGDANQGKWIFAGQDRGNGGGSVPVPSLNIHTDQNAENPAVAGGSTSDPTKPAPWITWQETSTATGHPDQIFVVRSEGPGMANCTGVTPAGVTVGSAVPSIGGFCWQQTGVPRYGTPADPTLNVDPTRGGIEPGIAFTGASDAVPWVVWYEDGTSGTAGLHGNDMVFAAKAVANSVAADGGFAWEAVGNQLSAPLDVTDTCGKSATNEAQCSLNGDPDANAEDPRVGAGTMTPGTPTVPWVAWDETVGSVSQIFVSRLVGSGATAHFALANGNSPISTGTNDSTHPDIAFSGNTPYVTWHEDIGGGAERAFVGHFVDASSPTFRLDESDVPVTPTTQANVREPISSSCIANPFNGDGSACQGGALGTPFFLSTRGMSPSPLGLFADAYQPATPTTGTANAVTAASATVGGSIDPAGAPVRVSFQFGTTTGYGLTTPAQTLGPGDDATGFTAALSALPAGTTIHYRAVATTDFGTLVGTDQTFVTATPTPAPQPTAGVASAGRVRVSGTTAIVPVSCSGATSCRVALTLTVHETLRGRRIVAVTARHAARRKHRLVLIGSSSATVGAGHTAKLHVTLNRTGRRLLSGRHRLTATLTVTQRTNGKTKRVARRKVTLKAPRARRRRQH